MLIALPSENEKSKGKIGETQNSIEHEAKQTQKSNDNPDWQDGGNMTGIDTLQ